MNQFFCFGIILTLFSYFFLNHGQDNYEKIANEITAKTAEKLKVELGLIPVGSGGQMMGDIQKMMIGFNFYKVSDINTSRQLLICAVEKYLSEINNNTRVKKYLHNYPFTAENIEIVIYFYDLDHSKVPSGEIKIAAVDQGKITYYIDDPENYKLKYIHKETYEEAKRTVGLILISRESCN